MRLLRNGRHQKAIMAKIISLAWRKHSEISKTPRMTSTPLQHNDARNIAAAPWRVWRATLLVPHILRLLRIVGAAIPCAVYRLRFGNQRGARGTLSARGAANSGSFRDLGAYQTRGIARRGYELSRFTRVSLGLSPLPRTVCAGDIAHRALRALCCCGANVRRAQCARHLAAAKPARRAH